MASIVAVRQVASISAPVIFSARLAQRLVSLPGRATDEMPDVLRRLPGHVPNGGQVCVQLPAFKDGVSIC